MTVGELRTKLASLPNDREVEMDVGVGPGRDGEPTTTWRITGVAAPATAQGPVVILTEWSD